MTHAEAMQRALALAWKGWGRVHPNPMVGAVVLQGRKAVGEGFHAEFGGPHAEAAALEQAGERARGGTLVVTLEPCAHQGQQPPCTGLVLASGVERVVIAQRDPNPLAAGGAGVLRDRGLEVEIGLLEAEACRQNAIFLHRVRTSARPFVALKLATSIDGRIADPRGASQWISGEPAREWAHWLRAGFDALGVGAHTATVDDARLTVRGPVTPRVPPRRVIFDRLGRLPQGLRLWREGPPPIIVTAGAPAEALAFYQARGATVIAAADPAVALGELRAAGITSLLVEGGGRLAGALLRGGLVDRYYWVQAPMWLGEAGVPAYHSLPSPPLSGAERWHVAERRALGDDTLLVLDREPCSPAS